MVNRNFVGALDLIPNQGKVAYSTSQLLTANYDGPIIRINGKDWGPNPRGLLPIGRIYRALDGNPGKVDILYDQGPTGAHVNFPTPADLNLFGQGGRPQIENKCFGVSQDGIYFDCPSNKVSYMLVSSGDSWVNVGQTGDYWAGYHIHGGYDRAQLDMFSYTTSPWFAAEGGGPYSTWMKDEVVTCKFASVVWEKNFYRVNGFYLPSDDIPTQLYDNTDQWPPGDEVETWTIGPMLQMAPIEIAITTGSFQSFMCWEGWNENEMVPVMNHQIDHFSINSVDWKTEKYLEWERI